jgi:hypothetical protein
MLALSREQCRCETDVNCVSELKMLEKDLFSWEYSKFEGKAYHMCWASDIATEHS